jgi:hypothetical protein
MIDNELLGLVKEIYPEATESSIKKGSVLAKTLKDLEDPEMKFNQEELEDYNHFHTYAYEWRDREIDNGNDTDELLEMDLNHFEV